MLGTLSAVILMAMVKLGLFRKNSAEQHLIHPVLSFYSGNCIDPRLDGHSFLTVQPALPVFMAMPRAPDHVFIVTVRVNAF